MNSGYPLPEDCTQSLGIKPDSGEALDHGWEPGVFILQMKQLSHTAS